MSILINCILHLCLKVINNYICKFTEFFENDKVAESMPHVFINQVIICLARYCVEVVFNSAGFVIGCGKSNGKCVIPMKRSINRQMVIVQTVSTDNR